MEGVEAVCFDLDSTLCIHNQSDEEIHEAVFDLSGIEPLFTVANVRAVDPADVETAESDAEFYTNLYKEAVRPLATDPDSELLSELGEITTDVIDESDVSFRQGAKQALDCARAHYSVGLITNGGETTQHTKLETLGITDLFDVIVYCHPAAGIDPKPAAKPFEKALSELDVSPESTVHIGDNHRSDVVGAHRMGMQSVWVPPERPHDTYPENPVPAPTHRLESLSELATLL